MAPTKQTIEGASALVALELQGAPWFRLEIYQSVPDWSQLDWYRAIACRHHEQLWLEIYNAPSPEAVGRIEGHCGRIALDPIGTGHLFTMRDRTESLGSSAKRLRGIAVVDELGQDAFEELRGRVWGDGQFALLAIDLAVPDRVLKARFEVPVEFHLPVGRTHAALDC